MASPFEGFSLRCKILRLYKRMMRFLNFMFGFITKKSDLCLDLLQRDADLYLDLLQCNVDLCLDLLQKKLILCLDLCRICCNFVADFNVIVLCLRELR